MDNLNFWVDYYYVLAKQTWATELINWGKPRIDISLTKDVAGYAFYFENKIAVNYIIYDSYREAFKETVCHEIAHLITYQMYGLNEVAYREHGDKWVEIMDVLGMPANDGHDYDTSFVKNHNFKFLYKCNCGKEHKFSKTRHAQTQEKRLDIKCICGEEPTFAGKIEKIPKKC